MASKNITEFRDSLGSVLSGSRKGYMKGARDYDEFLKTNNKLVDNLKFYGTTDCPTCEHCLVVRRVALYFNEEEHIQNH